MTTPDPYSAAPGAVAPRTNILAIVALVLSIIGFTVIGIILGFVALSQVKKTGESGRGLALAAVIIGFVELVLAIIIIIVAVVIAANTTVVTPY